LQIKITNSDVLYHINPNKEWQTHLDFLNSTTRWPLLCAKH